MSLEGRRRELEEHDPELYSYIADTEVAKALASLAERLGTLTMNGGQIARRVHAIADGIGSRAQRQRNGTGKHR